MGDSMDIMNIFNNSDEITIEDIESKKFNLTNKEMEQINLAKRIRKIVQLRNFKIDITAHSRNTNKILYDFIEACGFTVRSFIISYLGAIQPYCIERNQNEEYDKTIRCIIDPTYKIPLYIKIEFKQHEECLISFHENHFTKLSMYKNQISEYIVLFADSMVQMSPESKIDVRFSVTLYRGVEKFNIEGFGYNLKDNIVKCEASVVENEFNRYTKETIKRYLNNRVFEKNNFNYLKVSFTSYGVDSLNKLSMLVDYFLSGISLTQERCVCMHAINHTIGEILKRSDGIQCLEIFYQRLNCMQSNKIEYIRELIREVLPDESANQFRITEEL